MCWPRKTAALPTWMRFVCCIHVHPCSGKLVCFQTKNNTRCYCNTSARWGSAAGAGSFYGVSRRACQQDTQGQTYIQTAITSVLCHSSVGEPTDPTSLSKHPTTLLETSCCTSSESSHTVYGKVVHSLDWLMDLLCEAFKDTREEALRDLCTAFYLNHNQVLYIFIILQKHVRFVSSDYSLLMFSVAVLNTAWVILQILYVLDVCMWV